MSTKTRGGSGIAQPMPDIITLLEPPSGFTSALNTGNDPDYLRTGQLLPLTSTDHDSQILEAQWQLKRPVTDNPDATIRAQIYADDGGAIGDLVAQSVAIPVNSLPDPAALVAFQFGLITLPAGDYHQALSISDVLTSSIEVGVYTGTNQVNQSHAPVAPGAWINEPSNTSHFGVTLRGS